MVLYQRLLPLLLFQSYLLPLLVDILVRSSQLLLLLHVLLLVHLLLLQLLLCIQIQVP
jgi:hypothetical protein